MGRRYRKGLIRPKRTVWACALLPTWWRAALTAGSKCATNPVLWLEWSFRCRG